MTTNEHAVLKAICCAGTRCRNCPFWQDLGCNIKAHNDVDIIERAKVKFRNDEINDIFLDDEEAQIVMRKYIFKAVIL